MLPLLVGGTAAFHFCGRFFPTIPVPANLPPDLLPPNQRQVRGRPRRPHQSCTAGPVAAIARKLLEKNLKTGKCFTGAKTNKSLANLVTRTLLVKIQVLEAKIEP